MNTFHAFKAPTASQQVEMRENCAAATALKGAAESLNGKVSDLRVVMARASVNEAQRMVDDLLLDAVKNKTVQVRMIWQILNWRSMVLLESPYREDLMWSWQCLKWIFVLPSNCAKHLQASF